MREEHRELVLNRLGRASGKALQLLERLYFRPIVSVQTVAEVTGLSLRTRTVSRDNLRP